GAEIVLTGFGRAKRMTERSANRLDPVPDAPALDVNKPEDIEAVAADLKKRWGRVDGVLHAIAFAPEDALGGNFLNTPPESAITAFQTSAFSLKAVAVGLADLFPEEGASIVGLDFDATVAWPVYDWMGVAKAALEATARYPARASSPGSATSRTRGAIRPRSAGTSTIRPRSPPRSTSCSPTRRAPSPRRSSTSTAASPRWAPLPRRCASRSRRETRRLPDGRHG